MSDYIRNNRIAEALSIRNMKQVDLCEHTGIKKASINGWIKQRYQPKQEALYKMARALDVSEMWLAGYDVPMERPELIRHTDIDITLTDKDKSLQFFIESNCGKRKDEEILEKLFTYILKLTPDQLATISSMVIQLLKVNGDDIND